VESIHRPIRDIQIFIDTGLLREPIRHIVKYQLLQIPYTDQLYYLRMHDSDTSVTDKTALLHCSLHFLPLKYEKAGKMADLLESLTCTINFLQFFYIL